MALLEQNPYRQSLNIYHCYDFKQNFKWLFQGWRHPIRLLHNLLVQEEAVDASQIIDIKDFMPED